MFQTTNQHDPSPASNPAPGSRVPTRDAPCVTAVDWLAQPRHGTAAELDLCKKPLGEPNLRVI